MSNTTTTPQAEHKAAIKRYEAAETALRKAQRAERSAPEPSAARKVAREQRLSWGAKKANAIRDIRQAELDMRLAGIEHKRYAEPEVPQDLRKGTSKRQSRPEADIAADLTRVRQLAGTLTDAEADVRHAAEIRIGALLREAKTAGYSLT